MKKHDDTFHYIAVIAVVLSVAEMYLLQYLQLTHRILQSLTDLFDS